MAVKMALLVSRSGLRVLFRCPQELSKVRNYCDFGVIAAKQPFKVELAGEKRYSWCSCGKSKKQPFCDGSHKSGTNMKPVRFTVENTCEVYLCGCKQTGTRPYCDGTHASDQVQSANID